MDAHNETRVYTVATAHLDTMWNWTLETTIRYHIPKTLQGNFSLMDKYPAYRFNFEGAYRYELMEEYYPELFERLKGYVKRGQWNPVGCAYENGDCNIPSPEALFRNFLYGSVYFEDKFGVRCNDIFLPDCFGFGYALPSIARHAGLLGFMTQKLSYGPARPVPFDIGRWYGVDGSFVYACLKMGQYETAFRTVREQPRLLHKLKENRKESGLAWTAAFHGADGDQGGAPKESSVAAVCREQEQNSRQEIKVLSARSGQIYEDLDALPPGQKRRLPRWDNELLLREHAPGAYTSRTMSKRLNRRCEELADCAERCASAAHWLGAPYPREVLTGAYKRVVAHQFHDDLTGTAVETEYARSWNDYFLSLNQFATQYTAAASHIAAGMDSSWVQGAPVFVNNPSDFPRRGAVEITLPWNPGGPAVRVLDRTGASVPAQVSRREGNRATVVFIASVPPLGCRIYDVQPSREAAGTPALHIGPHMLENQRYRVRLNRNGDIASILDKQLGNVELLDAPIRMALLTHEGSRRYPAWEMRYGELVTPPRAYAASPSFEIVEQGAARIALRTSRTAEGSRFLQTLYLEDGGDTLRVENEIEWRSLKTLLKTQFPLTVQNSRAAYDLGLGVITREKSGKELFEFPAQRFADLTAADGCRGVSIFSDSRIGWDQPDDHTLRLTGVATPKYDFKKESRQSLMDFGLNRYGFGIYSHEGGLGTGTQRQAEAFQKPMAAFLSTPHPGALGDTFSFGCLSDSGVQIKALKQAERGGEWIVRVQECQNRRHEDVRMRLGNGIAAATERNACEALLGGAEVREGELVFSISPYAPKTFAVTLLPLGEPAVSRPRQTDLSLPFEMRTASFHTALRAGTLNGRESLAGELLPRRLPCGEVTFSLAEPRGKNALACHGQELALPAGGGRLYLLVTSLLGDRRIAFDIGSEKTERLVPDFQEPVGAWDLFGLNQAGYVKDCTVAYAATHTHSRFGDNPGKRAYLFRLELPIPEHGGCLRLPQEENVLLFAAAVVQGTEPLVPGAPYYDRLEPRGLNYQPLPLERWQTRRGRR